MRFMSLRSDFPYVIFRQLDDASRSVFKENVRLNEALKYHMKETEDLQKLTASLAKKNASLTLDKVCLTGIGQQIASLIRRWQSLDREHSPPKCHFLSFLFLKACQSGTEYISDVFPPVVFTCTDPVYLACGPPLNRPHLLTALRGQSVVLVRFHGAVGSGLVDSPM